MASPATSESGRRMRPSAAARLTWPRRSRRCALARCDRPDAIRRPMGRGVGRGPGWGVEGDEVPLACPAWWYVVAPHFDELTAGPSPTGLCGPRVCGATSPALGPAVDCGMRNEEDAGYTGLAEVPARVAPSRQRGAVVVASLHAERDAALLAFGGADVTPGGFIPGPARRAAFLSGVRVPPAGRRLGRPPLGTGLAMRVRTARLRVRGRPVHLSMAAPTR